ncbi:hypothetical protein CUMW_022530 [Citrus unshiu]|nr:hypothetical protein CUMW_022530 [Citrus unshiu]
MSIRSGNPVQVETTPTAKSISEHRIQYRNALLLQYTENTPFMLLNFSHRGYSLQSGSCLPKIIGNSSYGSEKPCFSAMLFNDS